MKKEEEEEFFLVFQENIAIRPELLKKVTLFTEIICKY